MAQKAIVLVIPVDDDGDPQGVPVKLEADHWELSQTIDYDQDTWRAGGPKPKPLGYRFQLTGRKEFHLP